MSRVSNLNCHSHITNLVLHGNLGTQGVVGVPLFRKGHSVLCPLVLGLQRSSDLAGLGVGRASTGELLHTSVLKAVIIGRKIVGAFKNQQQLVQIGTTHQSIFRLRFQVELDESKA